MYILHLLSHLQNISPHIYPHLRIFIFLCHVWNHFKIVHHSKLYPNSAIFHVQILLHPWITHHNSLRFSKHTYLFHEAFLCNIIRCIHLRLCIFLFHVLILELVQTILHIHCFCVCEYLYLVDDLIPIILHMNLLLVISRHLVHS